MLSQRRKAWLKDKLHGLLMRKVPNLIRLIDMFEKTYKKHQEHLLEERFHDKVKNLKRKVYPYLLAYVVGFVAPTEKRRSYKRQTRSA